MLALLITAVPPGKTPLYHWYVNTPVPLADTVKSAGSVAQAN